MRKERQQQSIKEVDTLIDAISRRDVEAGAKLRFQCRELRQVRLRREIISIIAFDLLFQSIPIDQCRQGRCFRHSTIPPTMLGVCVTIWSVIAKNHVNSAGNIDPLSVAAN